MKFFPILSLLSLLSMIQCTTIPQNSIDRNVYSAQPLKATIMVIGAHPDDEGIFFGGTLPYYTRTLKVPVVFISMTANWLNSDGTRRPASYIREREMREAARRYGLENEPVFAFFDQNNRFGRLSKTWKSWGGQENKASDKTSGMERTSSYLAEQIRLYRPDVVITHGFTGEYGNPDHMALAYAASAAYDLAAGYETIIDDSLSEPIAISPHKIEGNPWQVKKLYTHYSKESDRDAVSYLFHDFWEQPTISGWSPRQVANFALKAHRSQGEHFVSSLYDNRGRNEYNRHPSELWSLIKSEVGPDRTVPQFTLSGIMGTQVFINWSKGDFLQNIPGENHMFAQSERGLNIE